MGGKLLALAIGLSLLCGCGGGAQPVETFYACRQTLQLAEKLQFQATVRADQGASVFDCAMDCVHTADETVVTLTAPDFARGVRATVSGEGGTLEYGGLALDIGPLREGNFSPAGAPAVICDALLTLHPTQVYTEQAPEGELLVVRTYVDAQSDALLYFDARSMTPLRAGLVSGGVEVITCTIENFTYN